MLRSLLDSSLNQFLSSRHHPAHHYRRIVIVGNSITRHPPRAEVGWSGDWGMAASSRDKDFVHILTRRFEKETPGAQVEFQNIAEWERTYCEYDLTRLQALKQFNPDLLIVRFGENVEGKTIAEHDFTQHFTSLLDYLAGDSTRVVVASSFWDWNPATEVMKQISEQRKLTYVPLAQLEKEPKNKATQFKDSGVANHPSDRGMQAIADAIWQKL